MFRRRRAAALLCGLLTGSLASAKVGSLALKPLKATIPSKRREQRNVRRVSDLLTDLYWVDFDL